MCVPRISPNALHIGGGDGRSVPLPPTPIKFPVADGTKIGMSLFIISNILGSSIQITTLPLVILSPLQASGLVFNSICATLILAEPFTRYSLAGTVLVCTGAALIAAFGALKEPAHGLDELLELLGKKGFLVWFFGTLVLVASILGAVKAVSTMSPRTKNQARVRMGRGIAYGCVRYVFPPWWDWLGFDSD